MSDLHARLPYNIYNENFYFLNDSFTIMIEHYDIFIKTYKNYLTIIDKYRIFYSNKV